MSNPFGDFDDNEADGEILEGFICPICREDLKSLELLTDHFDKSHAEDDDLKTLFKEIFSKAKKKINFDLSRNLEKNATISSTSSAASILRETSNARSRMNVFNFMDHQEVGIERPQIEYFQSIRNPRLERYASETNKLIIRLHKLLKDLPADAVLRKQHEQNIVPWLDGSSVKLCPNCAKSFHIARRQHHCRLCGSIMCHDCSKFLAIESACVALGAAATTSHQDVEIIVFLAIMLHKAPAAFGLVSFLLHEKIERQQIRKHLAIFSLSAPLLTLLTYFGIGQEQKETLNSVNATGIAMLFSAGTFLYVATVHVLPELTQGGHSHSSHSSQYRLLEDASSPEVQTQIPSSPNGLSYIELFIMIFGAILPLVITFGHHH